MSLKLKKSGHAPFQSSHSSLVIRRRLRSFQKCVAGLAILVLSCLFIRGRSRTLFPIQKRINNEAVFDLCDAHANRVNRLPEFDEISFEQATEDDVLTGWEEDWVAFGQLPHVEGGTSLGRTTVDAVLSWVNGSDPHFAKVRKQYATASSLNSPGSSWLEHSLARHREWSQIQWAATSCAKNIENLNRIQLVNSHSQVPEYPDLLGDERHQLEHLVDFIPDYSLYGQDARKCTIPTFNSVSIEVNMGAIPSKVDKFIYLCDDMLLTKKYTDADIHTPLFGLSMIIYDAMVWNVDTDDTYSVDQPQKGEYPEYHHSSYLFNSAFGKRNRAYVRHATKVYSRKLLREVQASFPRAYADAATSRFRGDKRVINPHFHAHHYVIERHRKALLWSFLKLKSDHDHDQFLSLSERLSIKDVLDTVGDDFPARVTRRTVSSMPKDLRAGGFSTANALKIRWSSFDGPSYSFFNETHIHRNPEYHEFKTAVPDKPNLRHRCDLDYDKCFGPGFFDDPKKVVDVNTLLNHLARDAPSCGDCLINKLVLASGEKGLNALLPTPAHQDLRDIAVKAIMRYSYTKNKVLGNMVILGPSDYDLDLLKYKLDIITQGQEALPSQMCVNDDVPMDTPAARVTEIRDSLTKFYRQVLDGPTTAPDAVYTSLKMPQKSDYL